MGDRSRIIQEERFSTLLKKEEIPIVGEVDLLNVRRQVRAMAEWVGFHPTDVVKLLTVASELSHNIYRYAEEGIFRVEGWLTMPQGIRMNAIDRGPGIEQIEQILNGTYRSRSGMGLGLIGCRNIMDTFDIKTGPQQGTHITVVKYVRESWNLAMSAARK